MSNTALPSDPLLFNLIRNRTVQTDASSKHYGVLFAQPRYQSRQSALATEADVFTFKPQRICFTAPSTLEKMSIDHRRRKRIDSLLAVTSHWNLGACVDDSRNMSRTQLLSYDLFDLICKFLGRLLSICHFQEQNHRLIRVCLPPTPNTQCIRNLFRKPLQQHVINLRALQTEHLQVSESHRCGPTSPVRR